MLGRCIIVGCVDKGQEGGDFCDALLEAELPFRLNFEWQRMANKAFDLGASYVLLLGDDIQILKKGMFEEIKSLMSKGNDVVAVRELGAPSWPSFPAVSTKHIMRFGGSFFPERFLPHNQEGDPWLFETYRRFGMACFTSQIYLENVRGGVRGGLKAACQPSYTPTAINWREELENASEVLEVSFQRLPTMDIVIPSYRLDISILKGILKLRASGNLQCRTVIVVDGRDLVPETSAKQLAMRHLELSEENCIIRVNETNIGAGLARQRAVDESHADFILCLDDDVIPNADLLDRYERAILEHPEADGYVGLTEVPFDERSSVAAAHYSFLTYFFRISLHSATPPWGVTANLVLRNDGKISFRGGFAKLGGGEDCHACIGRNLVAVPEAKVTHPIWADGSRRVLWARFFRWAFCDGLLTELHPELCYWTLPDGVELAVILILCCRPLLAIQIFFVDLVLGAIRVWKAPKQAHHPHRLRGTFAMCVCSLEASFCRILSEAGHLAGHCVAQRPPRKFDWFLGKNGNAKLLRKRLSIINWIFFSGLVVLNQYYS